MKYCGDCAINQLKLDRDTRIKLLQSVLQNKVYRCDRCKNYFGYSAEKSRWLHFKQLGAFRDIPNMKWD